MRRVAAGLLLVSLAARAGASGVPCPPGLGAAAEVMRQTMQQEQERIRDSTLSSPQGVEETVQFDLGAHACHRGPGQAYRIFGAPQCMAADGQGVVPVRYPYALRYRKALTLDELFLKPWQPGSDGLQQVQFEPEGERWVPVARKEILIQLEGRHPAESGPDGEVPPSR